MQNLEEQKLCSGFYDILSLLLDIFIIFKNSYVTTSEQLLGKMLMIIS